ncbi:MAG TPA: YdeI/OmpD-associated family protein [Actinomycetota bacterium]|nr:YdeI/OmpD-associated family protein [Actinomycetota bacterium]
MTAPLRNLLHLTSRDAWRAWLERHYRTESEAWLVYHRKGSGKPRIPYNDAVEEALCFGWIDSTYRGVDDRRYAQRFTPRRRGSPYSAINMERLRRLAAQGLIKEDVVPKLPDLSLKRFRTPPDIVAALKRRPEAWRNYRRFPAAYKRIRVGFIEAARSRPEEFRKRLDYFVKMTERNKRFGFGGIEGYFEDETKEAKQ